MARLRGRNIVFEIDGVEYQGATKTILFDSEVDEAGFGDYTDSLKFTLQVEGFQDYASSSLWRKLWDNPGVIMNVTFAPHGNDTATATQPHFTVTGYAEKLPQLGGSAGEYFVFDVTVICTGKPTIVTTGTI